MKNYDNYFLPVDNMEDAKEFYGKTLGLNLKFDFSDMGIPHTLIIRPFGIQHVMMSASPPIDMIGNMIGTSCTLNHSYLRIRLFPFSPKLTKKDTHVVSLRNVSVLNDPCSS